MSMESLDRRRFLTLTAGALAGAAFRPDAAEAQVTAKEEGGIAWYDVKQWGIEGRGWNDTAKYFDRLPSRAEGKVRAAVWNLSRHSAGMLVRFETNASAIHTRYNLTSANLAMPHMPATGVSGLDLYARDERGRDRWLNVTRPAMQLVKAEIINGVDPAPEGRRLYTAYLPLYNGVESLEIGVPSGSTFAGVAPRKQRPILFYGTSIMHGACASRPGMSISALLGRRFNLPTINLGFSGNGQMEKEVGEFLVELDPCVYAIDCLPNMNAETVSQRAEPLVRQLRAARPDTPILLVEDRSFTNSPFLKGRRDHHAGSRAALRKAYDALTRDGVKKLYYLKGEDLLGDDGEGATDGSHPNDLGFVRYADAYEKVLKRIL